MCLFVFFMLRHTAETVWGKRIFQKSNCLMWKWSFESVPEISLPPCICFAFCTFILNLSVGSLFLPVSKQALVRICGYWVCDLPLRIFFQCENKKKCAGFFLNPTEFIKVRDLRERNGAVWYHNPSNFLTVWELEDRSGQSESSPKFFRFLTVSKRRKWGRRDYNQILQIFWQCECLLEVRVIRESGRAYSKKREVDSQMANPTLHTF
jgi:hypothetical protein